MDPSKFSPLDMHPSKFSSLDMHPSKFSPLEYNTKFIRLDLCNPESSPL